MKNIILTFTILSFLSIQKINAQHQKMSKKNKLKEKILKSDEWQEMTTAHLAFYEHKKNRFRYLGKNQKSNYSSYVYILNELGDNLIEKQKVFRKTFPKTHKYYNPEEFADTFIKPLNKKHKTKYSNRGLSSN